MPTVSPSARPDTSAADAVRRRDRLTRSLRALRRLRENLEAGDPVPSLAEIVALTALPHPGSEDPRVALPALIASAEAERQAVNRQIRLARALADIRLDADDLGQDDETESAPAALAAPPLLRAPAPPVATLVAQPLLDEAARLGKISARNLDSLPYGAILLDANGRILTYNDAESRMARLPVEAVLGRNFFTEVAPCTRVKEFEGRFRALAAGEGPGVVTFDFTFPFAFGAQNITVLLTRGALAGTIALALIRK